MSDRNLKSSCRTGTVPKSPETVSPQFHVRVLPCHTLRWLELMYTEAGRRDPAEKVLTKVVELSVCMYGDESEPVYVAKNAIGNCLMRQSRSAEALASSVAGTG